MSDTIVSDTGAGPPFRAEHVGSLLRPAALLAARAEYEGGWITAEDAARIEDDCIRHAVGCRPSSASRASPTASSAAAPGTWIFSIRSAASKRPTGGCISQFKNEAGTVEFSPAAHRVGGKLTPRQDDFRRGFRLPQIGGAAGHDAETDDPVAVDAALPRRPGGDRLRPPIPTWRRSGTTSPRSTSRRSPGWRRSAAPICSWTIPASPI